MKRTLLLAVTVTAALAGIVLFMRPGMEQAKKQAAQDALLQSIEEVGGAVLPPSPAHHAAEVDVYRTQIGGVEEPAPPPSPDIKTEPEAPAAVEPPQEITGIGILTIGRINLKMPVTAGATTAQLDVAAGWIPETAPIGETGNAVVAGHRSYTHGRQFNRLGELKAGDVIEYAPIGGEPMAFTVTGLLTIEPGDPAALEQPEDRQLLTLYTCTPIRAATHRLLVRAERVVL